MYFSNSDWGDHEVYFRNYKNHPNIGFFAKKQDKFSEKIKHHVIDAFNNILNATKVGTNDVSAYFNYCDPYSNFQKQDTMHVVIIDVANRRTGKEEVYPFAERYIADIMTVVEIVDKMVEKKLSNLLDMIPPQFID